MFKLSLKRQRVFNCWVDLDVVEGCSLRKETRDTLTKFLAHEDCVCIKLAEEIVGSEILVLPKPRGPWKGPIENDDGVPLVKPVDAGGWHDRVDGTVGEYIFMGSPKRCLLVRVAPNRESALAMHEALARQQSKD